MATFMFGVLGSVLFWIIYFIISFFMAVTLCKYKDNKEKRTSTIINVLVRGTIWRCPEYGTDYKDKTNTFDRFTWSFVFMWLMVLWPGWFIVIISIRILKCVFKLIEQIIVLGLKNGPTIQLSCKKDTNE